MQAVEGRPVHIGKTLDTTDDAARLTVIHSRVSSKKVSVYVRDGSIGDLETAMLDFIVRTDRKGDETQALASRSPPSSPPSNPHGVNDVDPFNDDDLRTLKPLGMYYEAADVGLVDIGYRRWTVSSMPTTPQHPPTPAGSCHRTFQAEISWITLISVIGLRQRPRASRRSPTCL